jgi:molecular chaperone DnaK (HSP70)
MSFKVGIDFGTSNSGVAVYDGQRVKLLPVDPKNVLPEVIKTVLYITKDYRTYLGPEATGVSGVSADQESGAGSATAVLGSGTTRPAVSWEIRSGRRDVELLGRSRESFLLRSSSRDRMNVHLT